MKKILTALFSVISIYAQAASFTGKCLLEVNEKKYIDGQCEITMSKGGSFQISKSDYFASVFLVEKGIADGHWNGEPGATHAHDPLGTLTRKGACWQNDTAKVCAWK